MVTYEGLQVSCPCCVCGGGWGVGGIECKLNTKALMSVLYISVIAVYAVSKFSSKLLGIYRTISDEVLVTFTFQMIMVRLFKCYFATCVKLIVNSW